MAVIKDEIGRDKLEEQPQWMQDIINECEKQYERDNEGRVIFMLAMDKETSAMVTLASGNSMMMVEALMDFLSNPKNMPTVDKVGRMKLVKMMMEKSFSEDAPHGGLFGGGMPTPPEALFGRVGREGLSEVLLRAMRNSLKKDRDNDHGPDEDPSHR